MNIFGLEGIGYIISLAMTLLISGVIMFYCLRRFKILENNLVEQGNILKTFIMRHESEVSNSIDLASSTAIEAAKRQTQDIKNISESKRIEVSDDETDDSDNETCDETCDDSKYDSDEVSIDNNPITLITQELETNNFEEITLNTPKDSIKTIEVESIVNTENNVDDEELIKEINVNDKVDETLENNDTKRGSIKKMKVDELRDLVIKETIETPENVKNMKKEQLIKLLTEK